MTEIAYRYVAVCDPCIAGEGEECHSPSCALFLRDVPDGGLIEAFAQAAPTEQDVARAIYDANPADEPWLLTWANADQAGYLRAARAVRSLFSGGAA